MSSFRAAGRRTRRRAGPSRRLASHFSRLLPASLILGGGFLVGADTLARTAAGIELPLGILTALHAAPLGLAIAHQAGAILTFSLALRATHRALYPIATAIRDQK